MGKCLRCQTEFTGRKGKLYCTEFCRAKAEKLRNRRRHAHPRPPPRPKPIKIPRSRKVRIRKRPTLEQRLLLHSIPEPNTGCLLWLGKVSRKGGYAQIWHKGRHRNASRVAYEVWVGSIPDGEMACHHCDEPTCIAPAHLYAGTAKNNYDDMVRRGRYRPPYSKKPRPVRMPKFAGEGI